MAAIQSQIHQDETAHIYGPSTSNTRIEGLWSKMSSVIRSWLEFFDGMCAHELFHKGHQLETAALRFVFTCLIQKSLNDFGTYWNTHHITGTNDIAGGVPDVMFYSADCHSQEPTDDSLRSADEVCEQPTITGTDTLDEYLHYIMELENFNLPSSKQEGVVLYERLLYFLNQQWPSTMLSCLLAYPLPMCDCTRNCLSLTISL